jgi:hypothetical protein
MKKPSYVTVEREDLPITTMTLQVWPSTGTVYLIAKGGELTNLTPHLDPNYITMLIDQQTEYESDMAIERHIDRILEDR